MVSNLESAARVAGDGLDTILQLIMCPVIEYQEMFCRLLSNFNTNGVKLAHASQPVLHLQTCNFSFCTEMYLPFCTFYALEAVAQAMGHVR